MRSWLKTSLIALSLVVAWPAVSASAQDDVEMARHHYEAGRSYYEQIRYAEAAAEFEEAYRLSNRPHLLKNVAVSHQHAEAWQDAIDAFERYLEEVPDASDRQDIEERVERLRVLAAEGAEEDPDLAEPNADRDLVGEEEHVASEELASEGGGFPTASVVTLGVGVALGIGAVITGLISNDIYTDLEASCLTGTCDPALEADRDRGQTMAVASTILTFAAAAAGVAAVILFFTVDQNDEESDEATARLTAGPGEVGVGMAVGF